MIRKNEKGEGGLHQVLVIVFIVVMFLMFPNTFYGFVGWVGDSVYKVMGAEGPSPLHHDKDQPPTSDTKKLAQKPAKDGATGNKGKPQEEKKKPAKKDG